MTIPEFIEPLPTVAVVILHWEKASIEDTIECLESLSKVDYPHLSIVLVNNGSPSFDAGPFQRAAPGITIVASAENLGFTGGNNLGIARALCDGADFVLLLNNDTVVRTDLISSLLPVMSAHNIGIAGPVVTYYDAPDRVWFAGGIYNRFLGYTFHTHMDSRLAAAYRNRVVDFVTGCALLVKREVFEAVGFFWDALFIYFEDAEFCLRAARANYRCVLVGKPLVRHKVSGSMGGRGVFPFSPNTGYYYGRNPLLLLRRNSSRAWAVIGMLGLFVVIYPYNVLQCLAAGNSAALRSYLVGVWDGIFGRQGKRR